jgi:glycosyltransferase involved in cell wall biosynthesis
MNCSVSYPNQQVSRGGFSSSVIDSSVRDTSIQVNLQRRPLVLFMVNRLEFFLSHRLPLALEAKSRGWGVAVASPESPNASVLGGHNISFVPIRFDRESRKIYNEIRNLASVWKCIRSVRPDVVHAVTIKPVLYGGVVCRLLRRVSMVACVSGLGYVFTESDFKRRVLRFLVERAYRHALQGSRKTVIFQNEDDVNLFVASKLVSQGKVRLVRGSGVDGEHFSFAPEPCGRPVVLFASRLLRDKGILEFIAAAEKLKARDCQARFVVAGEIDSANPSSITAAEVEKLSRSGIVEWLGHVTDMRSLLRWATIVCLPSYREGLPKVLIEAAATGRAIITTDVPGCRDVVRHELNGILVPPRSIDPLCCAIEWLLANPTPRREMGGAGRRLFEDTFALPNIVKDTFAIYAEILGPAYEVTSRSAAAGSAA